MRESSIEAYLTDECKKRKWRCIKFVSPGWAGVPDRIVLAPKAVILFVELKAPGQKPRKRQKRRHDQLRELGQQVYTIDSKQQVKEFIENVEKEVGSR